MKKSLIALAVLGFAGGAMAQSSVTLYGIANVGFGGQTGQKFQMRDAPNGTQSRWGLRGTEDLGGGMSVNFMLESGVNLPAGGGNNDFMRSSWLSVAGGFGTIRMGRDYTIGLDTSAWTMPSTRTSAQRMVGFGFNGDGVAQVRQSNQIKYISPDFSGFKVEAAYTLENNDPLRPMELGLMYANGPLRANFNYYKAKGLTSGLGLNAAYNFGSFSVLGGYVKTSGTTHRGFWLGANATFGAFNPWIQVARNTKMKNTGWELGVNYSLSKRTRLYAVYGHSSKIAMPAPANYKTAYGVGIQHSF